MSITQVAHHAGVSASTVSRYLRGSLALKPDTAQKINEAVLLYGYSPRIRTDSRTLALIVPDLQNPFYSSLAQNLSQAAHSRDYTLDIKVSEADREQERSLVEEVATQNRYHGLLYAGLNESNPSLRRIAASTMRLVVLDETIDDPKLQNVSSVVVDNYSGAYQAVSYLISLGHRRIAYLSGPASLSTSSERLRGYSAALANAKIRLDQELIFSGPYTEEFGSSIFPYLIESTQRPTAIFCGSDIAAVGLLGAAEQYGISIPDHLSVIGCDGIHIGQWLRPQLTTLQQPVEDIAKTAIELIDQPLPQHVQLPLNLVIRASSAKPL